MGVVLGITMILYMIVFFLKVYCCLIPTQPPPIETSILELVVRALLLCVIRYYSHTHTIWYTLTQVGLPGNPPPPPF